MLGGSHPLVAFFSEALPGPNNLSNQAKLSAHPLGDTLNRKFFGTVNQLAWGFLDLKMIAESKDDPSAQI